MTSKPKVTEAEISTAIKAMDWLKEHFTPESNHYGICVATKLMLEKMRDTPSNLCAMGHGCLSIQMHEMAAHREQERLLAERQEARGEAVDSDDKFKREERYIVIKIRDAQDGLSSLEQVQLGNITQKL